MSLEMYSPTAARSNAVSNVDLAQAAAFLQTALFATSLLLLAVPLMGFGDRQDTQRKAFIAFLQTRIVDKPGLHIPIMSAEDTINFGPYAESNTVS